MRLIDVARKAGVHHTTVSAVLNNSQSCYASERTRQRILDAAGKLGYRPSALARGLVGQRTATLGVITTGYDLELVMRVMFGFEETARGADQFVLTANSVNRPELEDRAIEQLLDRAVDGLAIWPCHRGPHTELRRLIERRFPLVLFGENVEEALPADHVNDDAAEAGRIQARHLLECGRRHICLVESSERCGVNDRKIAGFEQVMAEAGQPVQRFVLRVPQFSLYSQHTAEFEQMRELFTGPAPGARRVDAVACIGDQIAQAVIRIALSLGLRVPEDVAVMGIGGISSSADGALPLSTVASDAEQIGRAAFELLGEQLDGKRKPGEHRHVVIKPYLQARASTLGRL